MHRQLGFVQGLRHRGVGQPGRQRRLVVGVQCGGVEITTVTVGGDQGERGGVAVEGEMITDDGQAKALAAVVLSQPLGQRSLLERAAADIEALVDLRVS